MKAVALAGGRGVAVVDDEDYERVAARSWHAHKAKASNVTYARAQVDGKKVLLHCFILGPGSQIDHRSSDGLDNRKDNLRRATETQNRANRSVQKNNATGFKGVYLHRRRGRYQARITVEKKSYSLGYFDSSVEAARAYDGAAVQRFGEFARLNFPAEVSS